MSRHTARLEHDLADLRTRITEIGERVGAQIRAAVHGLLERDIDALYAVVLGDLPINRAIRDLDADCHRFVARHLPAAGHLRFVSAVLRLDIELERVGDYAAAIARIGVQLDAALPDKVRAEIDRMCTQSVQMMELAVRAFASGDAQLAQDTKRLEQTVDSAYDRVFRELVAQQTDVGHAVRLLAIYDRLERVSDQAKNVCEEAIFVATGEVKAPKVYRVLFVDRDNAMWSQLAEALGRKAHRGRCTFDSGGIDLAKELDPRLQSVADELSVDLALANLSPIPRPLSEPPVGYHVVVSIGLELPEIQPLLPFHTSLQRWPAPDTDHPVQAARELSARIADLMETLRGDT